MIITIRAQATSEERAQLMQTLMRATGSLNPIASTRVEERETVVLDGTQVDGRTQELLQSLPAVASLQRIKTPYKLISRAFRNEPTTITLGTNPDGSPLTIGGLTASPVIMAGPCSVEGRDLLLTHAKAVKAAGAQVLRGGAYKPRTSPYQFNGLGLEGLKILAEAREQTGMPVVTEVMEPETVELVAEYADILQVGSRNMQNYPLLQAIGRRGKNRPVLLKRGLSSTIEEWLLAAEHIVANGNPNVIFCERGIRSYDNQTRNVLDIAAVPLLKELSHLPVVIDPSHAAGRRDLIASLSRAAVAVGADGLIIEAHPNPDQALSDGKQSITPETLAQIVREARILESALRNRESLSVLA